MRSSKILAVSMVLGLSFFSVMANAEAVGKSQGDMAFGFNSTPGFGGKYWLSEDYALRGGLNLGIQKSRGASTHPAYSDSSSSSYMSKSGTLYIGFENHLKSINDFSLYIGADVYLSKPTATRSFSHSSTFGSFHDETSDKTTEYGISGLVGIEYPISKKISLTGQTTLLSFSRNSTHGSDGSKSKDSNYSFSIGHASVGMLVYF